MINKPIVMESDLGLLVHSMKPERLKQVFVSQDKWFLQLLSMAATQGLKAEVKEISFEVSCWYEFLELKKYEKYVMAVYEPQFHIVLIEDGERRGWRVNYSRNCNDLAEILQVGVVERMIPDVVESDLVEINPDGNLVEKGKFWRKEAKWN